MTVTHRTYSILRRAEDTLQYSSAMCRLVPGAPEARLVESLLLHVKLEQLENALNAKREALLSVVVLPCRRVLLGRKVRISTVVRFRAELAHRCYFTQLDTLTHF